MARKRARGEAPWIFRILLLPMLYGYLRLLSFLDYPSLDFVFQLPNAPFLTYGRNYLLLAACLLGFLLILFAAPGRRLPLGFCCSPVRCGCARFFSSTPCRAARAPWARSCFRGRWPLRARRFPRCGA